MKTLLLLAYFSTAAYCADDVTDWIKANSIPLSTVEAGHGFEDMQPLMKIVGEARIVALGEATHGSREFFQLKHRMLEFLATEMGFTIFSIEANMPESYRLNEYVLTGKGDPKQLLSGLYFWTWNTEEVLAMIEWMREFNKSGKGRIEFTGFDMQTPNVAIDTVRAFIAKNDPTYMAVLETAAKQALEPPRSAAQANFGVATATIPTEVIRGKKVHLSGYVKTQDITKGYAGLWMRVDGPSAVAAFDNMGNRGITGTTDWTKYDIELAAPWDAKHINFGGILTGDGTAWIDGLTLELDGKPYDPGEAADFDFERSAQGFFLGGNGYDVAMDATQFHSGKQSLRMKFVGGVAPQKEIERTDPTLVVANWLEVLEHLRMSRESYLKKTLTAAEIDWIIQNSGIVLQCVQLRAGHISRDQSMASNVAWILEQSPKAKIVLWAHNGHVAVKEQFGYRPMGSFLRQAYGDKMVVFGFAFNQGGFQAVEAKKGLHDFTLPPAPAGSLDAKLASAGIPMFALDLRKSPKTGWWTEPHAGRSIGAMFADADADKYLYPTQAPKAYDALLFVEKTTPARKNTK